MASLFEDQAAGLRRLFAGESAPAVLAFSGEACGALLAGLARGLAAAGKEVLVIDEHAGERTVATAFGLRPRYDLIQAVNRDAPAGRVLQQAEAGICLLPAARAARQCARLAPEQRRALGEGLRRLQRSADVVLIHGASREAEGLMPLLAQPPRHIVVVTPESQSITAAYARMKRLAQGGDCRDFELVVLGARDGAEARTVLANLGEVAGRHLGARVAPLGGAHVGEHVPGTAAAAGFALAESLLAAHEDRRGRAIGRSRPRGAAGAMAACTVV
jgi:flagellar biosynthesis protein FlhG